MSLRCELKFVNGTQSANKWERSKSLVGCQTCMGAVPLFFGWFVGNTETTLKLTNQAVKPWTSEGGPVPDYSNHKMPSDLWKPTAQYAKVFFSGGGQVRF
jgi:hypothetical protein